MTLTKSIITLTTTNKNIEVSGYVTACGLLGVHRELNKRNKWAVTYIATGLRMAADIRTKCMDVCEYLLSLNVDLSLDPRDVMTLAQVRKLYEISGQY